MLASLHTHAPLILVPLIVWTISAERPSGLAQDKVDARARYVELCASCHGPEGDGNGTAELPRPARSFKDGGFSYGNTRAALLRTVTHGIPGTPMPAHGGTVSTEELEALVEYVISLGPPREEVEPAETVLTITDRAQIVRGYLPALVDGGPEYPRGLLLGTTTGASFEYRADDVRLLAVRQGEFVQRQDWTGRGGAPLRPLGQIAVVCSGGNPGPAFARLRGTRAGDVRESLRARLEGTWTLGPRAGLRYALLDPEGTVIARVHEVPLATQTSVGAGFLRRLRIEAGEDGCTLELDVRYLTQGCGDPTQVLQRVSERSVLRAFSRPQDDGLHRLICAQGPPGMDLQGDRVRVNLEANGTVQLDLARVTALDGGIETLRRMVKETR